MEPDAVSGFRKYLYTAFWIIAFIGFSYFAYVALGSLWVILPTIVAIIKDTGSAGPSSQGQYIDQNGEANKNKEAPSGVPPGESP